MIHIIKGFIIIATAIGSLYALSRFISNFFKLDDWDQFEVFLGTVFGLMFLFLIGMICYLVGGGV